MTNVKQTKLLNMKNKSWYMIVDKLICEIKKCLLNVLADVLTSRSSRSTQDPKPHPMN